MSEIDVTYCAFARLNDVCAGPTNTQECKCSKIPIQNCYYKQLQLLKIERDLLLNQLVVLDGEDVTVQVTQEQFEEYNKLKAENEELKNKNNAIHSIADNLQQRNHNLTLENEKMYKLGCKNYVAIEQAKRLYELNKCIDEIKEIINNFSNKDIVTLPNFITTALPSREKNYIMIAEQYKKPIKQILQKIKEVKG